VTERVVVVHDYLTQRGGAERVALALLDAFPDSRLVTSVYDPDATYPEFRDHRVDTLWLDRVRALQRDPRRALPLLARAFSAHEIRDADLVVCSSSGWAHGVRTDAPKIVYCHNPPRWLHQTADYVADQRLPARLALDVLRKPLTRWDRQAAATATAYLANSSVVAARIENTYGIAADVVPPPVTIDPAGHQEPVVGLAPGFLLTVSRARGYKHTDALAHAVQQLLPGERLVVVGGLPARADGRGWSDRVIGISCASDAQLRWLYAHCAALLAVSAEDFGLTPLEANAFGRPALCLRAGGYLDTLRPGRTGVFVDDATPAAIADGVRRLRATAFSEAAIRAHAGRFAPDVFAARIRQIAAEVRELRTARVPAQATAQTEAVA
jgi:glycosyltransferase involved in cell wall biosynthesis